MSEDTGQDTLGQHLAGSRTVSRRMDMKERIFLIMRLRRRFVFLCGKYAAARFCKKSEAPRNYEPKPIEVLESDLDTFVGFPDRIPVPDQVSMSDADLPLYSGEAPTFRQGFLEGLREVIKALTDEHPRTLFYQMGTLDGMQNALDFACRNKGNIDVIENKIKSDEELIARSSVSSIGLSPGAGPRIYRDGYIQGLKEALDIVKEFLSEPDDEQDV